MSDISAKTWNERYPVGQPVKVIQDDGGCVVTRTRSEAWTLGDGTHVIMYEGRSGGYALRRVYPIEKPEES